MTKQALEGCDLSRLALRAQTLDTDAHSVLGECLCSACQLNLDVIITAVCSVCFCLSVCLRAPVTQHLVTVSASPPRLKTALRSAFI